MINLIPNQQKKKMKRGFYYRLAIFSLGMLCISVFIAIIAIMPSYFLVTFKNNVAKDKLEAQKSETVPLFDQETLLLINDLNQKLDLVEREGKNKFNVSEKVIKSIILKKSPSIKITRFSYENTPGKDKKISLSGTAPSREVLLSFREALEDDTLFKSVDLPISNFIKGSNIQFYLNLVPL